MKKSANVLEAASQKASIVIITGVAVDFDTTTSCVSYSAFRGMFCSFTASFPLQLLSIILLTCAAWM